MYYFMHDVRSPVIKIIRTHGFFFWHIYKLFSTAASHLEVFDIQIKGINLESTTLQKNTIYTLDIV